MSDDSPVQIGQFELHDNHGKFEVYDTKNSQVILSADIFGVEHPTEPDTE